jgi:hypothetical protein
MTSFVVVFCGRGPKLEDEVCWLTFERPVVTIRARAHQGNWQPQFPRTFISLSWTHCTEWSRANWNGNTTHGNTEKLNFQATEHASFLTITLPRDFLMSAVLLRASVFRLFLWMARRLGEAANSVFVHSIEQDPGYMTNATQTILGRSK